MSFGFAVGDFIAVGKLAWTLYRECYQIARGAPQEFSLLVNELSTLSNSLTILQEEARDPKSTLTCAGDDRVRMVNEMVACIEDTLNRLRKVASKYDILGSGSKTKQIWAKLKWSAEFSSIDRLRNKLIYHNTVINLLLTSVGNSSLQRIESSNAALTNDVRAIKNYIASNQAVTESKVPVLSAVDDNLMSTTLGASLMISAEAFRPWSMIGFDQWIGAGKWWLLRAQLELRTIIAPEQIVSTAVYADLIKAGWILVDVIPCHPQFPFISASRSSELRSLSAEVKNEFSRITALAMVVPALSELSSQDLRLWESIPVKAPTLRPYKVSQDLNAWRADGGELVLFRGFACQKLDSLTTRPCILLFLVHESAKAAKLIAQDQYGDVFMAITIQEYIELQDGSKTRLPSTFWRGSSSVMVVGSEEFVLNHEREAQVLCNMIEATTFYILGRQADHASLEDLKAYMLLTAVKNQEEEAAAQIRQEICKMDDIVESDQKGSLAQLAVSITSRWIKGRLQDEASDWNHVWINDGLFHEEASDWSYVRRWSSLLEWAVACNHTTLIEYILSEDPVIDRSCREYGNWDSLELSAEHGNAPVVRWWLNNPRCRDKRAKCSLFTAIKFGHANVSALLIDAGVSLHDVYYDIPRHVLRSALSEVAVHAILAMAYATVSGSDICLRQAADRGHEGAVVLLSYADTMERVHNRDYEKHSTQDSGHFEQVVAILARDANTIPAFGLTLMAVERRRVEVILKVMGSPVGLDVRVYVDSYHAYVENVDGLLKLHKKAVKIGMSGRFSFTVVHQEESLRFGVSIRPGRGQCVAGYSDLGGADIKRFIFDNTCEDSRIEIPIILHRETLPFRMAGIRQRRHESRE